MADILGVGAAPQEGGVFGPNIMPKPALGDLGQSPVAQAQMANNPFMLFLLSMLGRRSPRPAPSMGVPQQRMPQVGRPANDNVRFPMLDSPNAVPRGGDPARSQTGRLSAMSSEQFEVYLDARSRGMSPQQAMSLATGD